MYVGNEDTTLWHRNSLLDDGASAFRQFASQTTQVSEGVTMYHGNSLNNISRGMLGMYQALHIWESESLLQAQVRSKESAEERTE